MQVIILSGGSGKRLWPLSNEVRSKQFIKILLNEETGEYESMVQRIYRQIKSVNPEASITIATSNTQVSSIKNQLGDKVSICIEPCRRDTFPAIALSSFYLKYIKNIHKDEPIIVCPVDPYVDESYFSIFNDLAENIEKKSSKIALMGMLPTYPSEKYGYIIPTDNKSISKVKCFEEKPTEEIAHEYIKKGALWNGGVFSFTLKYIEDIIKQNTGYFTYEELLNNYDKLEKISFDYAVLEKETSINVIRYENQWKDIGTWNTLTEVMSGNTFGKVILDESCKNTHVINTLNIPVLCMGTDNLIITASNDGILVSERYNSSFIKKHVESFNQQIMYAEKSWGSFTVLDVQKDSMTIKIQLKANNKLKYHCHNYRTESWNVISGEGEIIIDGVHKHIKQGDIISIPNRAFHTVIGKTDLTIIEVQIGVIDIKDKMEKALLYL
jgi:mannose-1-phosphate guanylyltransferase